MSVIRFTGDVLPDGSIRPPKQIQLPLGTVEVTVVQPDSAKVEAARRTSLADWADEHAENWGGRLNARDVTSFTGRSD